MTFLRHAVLVGLLLPRVASFRAQGVENLDVVEGDCSWARLDTSTGWNCETLKTFSGGFQGNTRKVRLHPPNGKPFEAVLKEMNSNQNVDGLASLENEKRVARFLQEDKGFKEMPQYFFQLKALRKYQKYKHIDSMSVTEKAECDRTRIESGKCELNEEWNRCNGNRGNLDTTKEIVGSRMKKDGLACPDTQLLAMEYLDGYEDLKGLQSYLSSESDFEKETRAAALFLAYDKMNAAGVSHCDFNPGNAMFRKNDPRQVKIIDFGLARTNDRPVGTCRGKLEDIGGPGALWLSLYRGHRNAEEFGNNEKKPGPWYLGARGPYKMPSGEQMLPFSQMSGKWQGKGNGYQAWNRETRQNWPAIVAYAETLMVNANLAAGGKPAENKPQIPAYDTPGPKKPVRAKPTPTRDDEPKNLGPKQPATPGNSGTPACKTVWADGRGQCRIKLGDKNPCMVEISCPYTRAVTTQEISQAQAGFGDRIEVPNCVNCKVKGAR